MPIDHTDWLGQSTFPHFGDVIRGYSSFPAAGSGAANTVVTITGKGILRGFRFLSLSTGEDGDGCFIPRIHIDGEANEVIVNYCFTDPEASLAETWLGKVTEASWEDSRVRAISKVQFPFSESLVLDWVSTYTGANPTISVSYLYSLY